MTEINTSIFPANPNKVPVKCDIIYTERESILDNGDSPPKTLKRETIKFGDSQPKTLNRETIMLYRGSTASSIFFEVSDRNLRLKKRCLKDTIELC